jgi:hypothetical protein
MPELNPYAKFVDSRPVVEILASTPAVLESLAEAIGAERLAVTPAPGKWTPAEILCHLADCEVAFGFRLRQTLAEDHHVLQPFDQDKWAATYPSVTAQQALAAFGAMRCHKLGRRRVAMKKIGVLFGMENSFPGALVERINSLHVDGITAEFVETGAVHLDKAPKYSVIVDRISHDIPFYRAFLKHAALNGTVIINNPFWWSADDKFFNYTLAEKLGVAVPPTVILPHKKYPEGTNDRSMRNLEYPLDWDGVFNYIGEHGFMKPVDGGGWRDVYHIHNREEFFARLRPVARPVHVVSEGGRFQGVFPLLCGGAEEGPHHAV